MRLLIISNCPPLEHLGSGYVIGNFAAGLRSRGHEVDLLAPDDYEVLQWCRRGNGYRQALGMWRATSRSLCRRPYDLVEFWGGEAWLAASVLRRQAGARRPLVVQHTNGPEPRYLAAAAVLDGGRARRWLGTKLTAHAFRQVDGVVTVSEGDRRWLVADARFARQRVAVVEPALPSVMLDEPFVERQSMRVGFCGSWIARKGIASVQEAVTRLYREVPEFSFVIAGVGAGFSAAEVFPPEIAARIEVHPMIHGKERLKEFYRSLSILVAPSLGESFGMVMPEAMACGCALVASPLAGFAAGLRDGEEAVLLSRGDAAELGDAIRDLLADPARRNRIAAAGWKRVQRMRWPEAVERLEGIYTEWLAEHRHLKK